MIVLPSSRVGVCVGVCPEEEAGPVQECATETVRVCVYEVLVVCTVCGETRNVVVVLCVYQVSVSRLAGGGAEASRGAV